LISVSCVCCVLPGRDLFIKLITRLGVLPSAMCLSVIPKTQ